MAVQSCFAWSESQLKKKAKEKDQKMKLQRTDEMNESKYKKQNEIDIGDRILIRNYGKQHKFDPVFTTTIYHYKY